MLQLENSLITYDNVPLDYYGMPIRTGFIIASNHTSVKYDTSNDECDDSKRVFNNEHICNCRIRSINLFSITIVDDPKGIRIRCERDIGHDLVCCEFVGDDRPIERVSYAIIDDEVFCMNGVGNDLFLLEMSDETTKAVFYYINKIMEKI